VGEDLNQEGAIAISKEAMEELGIQEGDTVEIYGAWIQRATAVLSDEDDITVARMDKSIREGLPCSIGECVGIRPEYRG
jgi:hypothetical protein